MALAGEEGVAVVELADEVEALAYVLDRVEEAEPEPARPRRQSGAGQHGVGREADRLSTTSSGRPNGIIPLVSTGLPKVTTLATPSLRRNAAVW